MSLETPTALDHLGMAALEAERRAPTSEATRADYVLDDLDELIGLVASTVTDALRARRLGRRAR